LRLLLRLLQEPLGLVSVLKLLHCERRRRHVARLQPAQTRLGLLLGRRIPFQRDLVTKRVFFCCIQAEAVRDLGEIELGLRPIGPALSGGQRALERSNKARPRQIGRLGSDAQVADRRVVQQVGIALGESKTFFESGDCGRTVALVEIDRRPESNGGFVL
jgi:hypothetical protein